MRILLIIFIFFSCYSSLNANEIFNLIKIPNLEVLNINSKNNIKYLISKKSFIIGVTKNINCNKVNESNLKKKYIIIKKNLDIYNYQFLKKNNIRFVVLCENLSISGIGTAGIPSAGIIMLTVIFTQIGIPLEGITLLLGVDRLLDMMRTSVNVSGDLCISCIVADSENKINHDVYKS